MDISKVSGYVVGLDLAKEQDYTALGVLRQWQRPTEERGPVPVGATGVDERAGKIRPATEACYDLIHLDRWRRRKYTEIAQEVRAVRERVWRAHMQAETDAGRRPLVDPVITLVFDRTGVGSAVSDIFSAAGVAATGVTITSGDSVTRDEGGYRVPKRDLVGVLQILLQNGRLKIAGSLPLASVMVAELENFRAKITLAGHDTYGAGTGEEWREGAHDDTVLAVALACWYAEHVTPPPAAVPVGIWRPSPWDPTTRMPERAPRRW